MAKLGRPKLHKTAKQRNAERAAKYSNISVSKALRDELNEYCERLSISLGVQLTITQGLTYLIKQGTEEIRKKD